MHAAVLLTGAWLAGGCAEGPEPGGGVTADSTARGSLEAEGWPATIRANERYDWRTSEYAWGRLHAPAWTPRDVDPDTVAVRVEGAIRDGLDLLGESGAARRFDVFLVESRDDVQELTDIPLAGASDPASGHVVLAGYGGIRTGMRRELMQVLARDAWGLPAESAGWLREGLATRVGGACAGHTFAELAAALERSGELLPLRALVDEFGEHDDAVAHLQSAAFTGWLMDRMGRDVVRDAWMRGLDAALDARDTSLEEVERNWRAELARAPRVDVDWTWIRTTGCG